VDRFVVVVEHVAGYCVGLVAVLTFGEAILRYVFNSHIPDGFVLGQIMQGIAICWGIGTAIYADRHVTVEVLWALAGPRLRRTFDLIAYTLNLAFMLLFGAMISFKVYDILKAGEISTEMHVPIWAGYSLASLGIVAAAALAALRWWQVVLRTR
jgi:TRAP-type C4-dicarboxylate transport system permease small subunit